MSKVRRTRHFARGARRLRIARRRGAHVSRLAQIAAFASLACYAGTQPLFIRILGGGGGVESVRTNGVSVLSGLNLEKM